MVVKNYITKVSKVDIVAKRHPSTIFRSYGAYKIHKNNNLNIVISNSFGRHKYKLWPFTRPSKLVTIQVNSPR